MVRDHRPARFSTIRGLAINRFEESGINLNYVSSVRIAGNFICTDPTGTIDLGNRVGILATGSLGSPLFNWRLPAGDRNLISGNGTSDGGEGHFLLLRRSKQHHG